MTDWNPGGNGRDPDAMTEEERLAKRRFQAGVAFEMMPEAEYLRRLEDA